MFQHSVPLNLGKFNAVGSGQVSNNSGSSFSSNNVQLAAIPLPIFTGNIRKWPTFLSAFTVFVIDTRHGVHFKTCIIYVDP